MTRAYRQSLRAASRIFRGEAAIITPEDRRINILNPTATEIWELCSAEARSSEQICAVMTERYSADAETIRTDVDELLGELVEMGALEVVDAETVSGDSS